MMLEWGGEEMNRKETTEFLGNLLIQDKFLGIGKYWAREVSIDFGTTDVKRIDFLQFKPPSAVCIGELEKGIFISYEVKSCKSDFNSGFGKNFIGEKNYFVMPMSLYKEVIQEIPHNVGVIVPIPKLGDKMEEFESPTELSGEVDWKLATILPAHSQNRKRSMTELLFCMLRAGH